MTKKKTQEQFISECIKLHGDNYTFEKNIIYWF